MSLRVSTNAAELIETAGVAGSAAEIGRSLMGALKPFGIRALYSRVLRGPGPDAAYVYSRISPPGWESLYGEHRYASVDFLGREVRRRADAFAWSEAPLINAVERELVNAVGAFDISDGIAVPVHGPGGYVGVTSLAFERLHEIAPADRSAIAAAALVLHLKMMALSPKEARRGPGLSPRERDCMAFIAEGKSDWEIGEALGVAETTVITHVQNAKRKLGARSRSHAVALCILAGLI
jgi:DNA-binding CsgD family transcriptional regulator